MSADRVSHQRALVGKVMTHAACTLHWHIISSLNPSPRSSLCREGTEILNPEVGGNQLALCSGVELTNPEWPLFTGDHYSVGQNYSCQSAHFDVTYLHEFPRMEMFPLADKLRAFVLVQWVSAGILALMLAGYLIP